MRDVLGPNRVWGLGAQTVILSAYKNTPVAAVVEEGSAIPSLKTIQASRTNKGRALTGNSTRGAGGDL